MMVAAVIVVMPMVPVMMVPVVIRMHVLVLVDAVVVAHCFSPSIR